MSSEIRRRREKKETPKPDVAEKKAPGYSFWPYQRVDEKLHPDRVLVFSPPKGKTDDVEKFRSQINSAIELLKQAGFYVACRRGVSKSVLLLIRASPELISKNEGPRDSVVQFSIPFETLRKNGLSENFAVAKDAGSFLSNFPGFFGLSLKPEAINNVEKIYGGFTAGVFDLSGFVIRCLFAVATTALVSLVTPDISKQFLQLNYLVLASYIVSTWWVYQSKFNKNKEIDQSKSVVPTQLATRRLLFLPVSIIILAFFTLILFFIFVFEIFCTQLYSGEFAKIVGLVPIAANAVASIIFSIVYGKFVKKWVEWEGYADEFEKEETIAQRVFYLDALIAYLPIVFSAFLYIPFGEIAARYTLLQFNLVPGSQYVPIADSFKLNTGRLTGQASFFMAKQHMVKLILTCVVPCAVLFTKRHLLHLSESAFNSRFAVEQLKAVSFSPNALASGLVISLGYTLFLSTVWPMGAVITFFAIWLRVRSSLFVLSKVSKLSPTPVLRTNTRNIGFWNTNLKAMLYLAAILTPAMTVIRSGLDSSISFTSSKLWLVAVVSSFIGENLVIVLFHVLTEVNGRLAFWKRNSVAPVSTSTEKETTNGIDESQDKLFAESNNIEELDVVFRKD